MVQRKNTVFIVELFLLFAALLLVTTVLTKTFVAARARSLYAERKTAAVLLAERAAEISGAAAGRDEAFRLLSEAEGTEDFEVSGNEARFTASVAGPGTDRFRVLVVWAEETGASGALRSQTVSVFYGEEADPIYVLDAGSFRREAADGQ